MITVTKNNQGHWLNFKSSSGKHASVHVESELLNGLPRSIIDKAIIETCEEDCAADYSEAKPEQHTTELSRSEEHAQSGTSA